MVMCTSSVMGDIEALHTLFPNKTIRNYMANTFEENKSECGISPTAGLCIMLIFEHNSSIRSAINKQPSGNEQGDL